MTTPLLNDLGYMGTTKQCEDILNGSYVVPPHSNKYAQEFFDQFKQVNPVHKPSSHLSTSQFKSGWNKMKEKTSSGISGLHFGHMKTCAKNRFLTNVESAISNVPFSSGYSPRAWRKGINVMIHKKANSDLVTNLRTIVLTEADFNYNNKVLGRETLRLAELNNALAKEQYGSRKGKSAIHHALHKRLTYDIIRAYKRPGAVCSNDAKSCFDRVVHSVAMLAYRRLGIEIPPVQCMLQTIQHMKHHIRTAYGDSEIALDGTGQVIPFQGILQGNGAAQQPGLSSALRS